MMSMIIAPDKRGYPHNIVLISPQKPTLLVLIRRSSAGASNEYPQHFFFFFFFFVCFLLALVAQLDAPPTGNQELRVPPLPGRQHSFVAIDHETFSTVIPSLLLIQEGQLSVSGERMCAIQVNRLED